MPLVWVVPLGHYLQFIDDKTLMFHGRYVDDTLVVIKSEDLKRVHNALNNFDRGLKFTIDTFNDVVPHFLDIEIHPGDLGIYCKPASTGQYTHYTSFSPWRYKTAWITNIIHRATVICDEAKTQAELNRIKKLIAGNGFPKWIGSVAKKLKNIYTANNKNQLKNENNENVYVIWVNFNLPYLGTLRDQLLLSFKRKIPRCLTKKVKSKVTQSTQKLCFYTNIKDKINKLMKSCCLSVLLPRM